jgi:cytochrome c biogenesis protein CcmG/thiol:disulfide interchange protein DsbE
VAAEPGTSKSAIALRYVGRIAALLVAGGFIALLVYGVLTKAPDATIDDNLARAQTTPAPPFELGMLQRGELGPVLAPRIGAAITDGRLALRELRGTPVVLNFWASWCTPCREEAPRLQRAWRDGRDDGVLFLGLNMQDITDDARLFMRTFRIDYPNVRDPGNRVAQSYGVTGLPETFFISRSGDVVGHVVGVVSPAQLRDGIAAAATGKPHTAREGGARKPTR